MPALRILFVDDDLNVLLGLERIMRILEKSWQIVTASSGTEALKVMQQTPADVVVSDMQMPGMDGIELLAKISRQYPDTIRFILSGYEQSADALRAANFAHRFLAKPVDVTEITDIIKQTLVLRDALNSYRLRQIVTQIESLPSLPVLYIRLMEILQSVTVSIDKVAEIVSQDSAMTAKILQLVNSAYFGLPQQVSSIKQAVILLGLNKVKTLALTVHIFSTQKIDIEGFTSAQLQSHSLAVSSLAKDIARDLGLQNYEIDSAFTAGMLHCIGALVLASNMPKRYGDVLEQVKSLKIALGDAERHILGVTHAEVSGYLLGLWGLPGPVVEGVLYYRHPEDTPYKDNLASPLMALHIANVLMHEIAPSSSKEPALVISPYYSDNIIVQDKLPRWRKLALQILGEPEDSEN